MTNLSAIAIAITFAIGMITLNVLGVIGYIQQVNTIEQLLAANGLIAITFATVVISTIIRNR